jgi:hypothetical protein
VKAKHQGLSELRAELCVSVQAWQLASATLSPCRSCMAFLCHSRPDTLHVHCTMQAAGPSFNAPKCHTHSALQLQALTLASACPDARTRPFDYLHFAMISSSTSRVGSLRYVPRPKSCTLLPRLQMVYATVRRRVPGRARPIVSRG